MRPIGSRSPRWWLTISTPLYVKNGVSVENEESGMRIEHARATKNRLLAPAKRVGPHTMKILVVDDHGLIRAALQGAASIAGLLITTEAMVAEVPRKQSQAMPGGGGGMGGMDF